MTNPATDRSPRADSQRNRAAIIDAALTCLASNQLASMTTIAKTAGVGRVTLYGHFSSRRELIDAASAQALSHAEAQLTPLNLEGNPWKALARLVTTSWRVLEGFQGLSGAAEAELGEGRIRENHDHALLRVRDLIERGQAAGDFRSDQSPAWLTACFFAILLGAAAEIRTGRLDEEQVVRALPDTIQSLMIAPPAT